MSQRPRDRILTNLEAIYREAYERAKQAGDQARMMELDWSYQREQLILEVLLDVRDALGTLGDSSATSSAVEKIRSLTKITKLAK